MSLKPGKNIRLFKNPVLETLTYVHPVMPAMMWIPILIYAFVYGITRDQIGVSFSFTLAGFGFFIWTLAEYLLHRFIFHYHASTPFGKRLMYLFHGIHHDDPEDQRRLLMPPAAAALIALILYSLFASILGVVNVKPFFSGFLVGYLCYDYIHFATHFSRFKSGTFLKLKQNHMKHHFVKPDALYGVSSTFWDKVFRT